MHPTPETAEKQEIKFFLNSRGKVKNDETKKISYADIPTDAFKSKIAGVFNKDHKVKIIVHGWTKSADFHLFVGMMKALLEAEPVNVVRVDWSVGANRIDYWQSAVNTQIVGEEIAKFINKLAQVLSAL